MQERQTEMVNILFRNDYISSQVCCGCDLVLLPEVGAEENRDFQVWGEREKEGERTGEGGREADKRKGSQEKEQRDSQGPSRPPRLCVEHTSAYPGSPDAKV